MSLAELGGAGLYLAGIVAGFGAIGWAGRKVAKGYRWLVELGATVQALNALAQYELTHNGGGSLKDHAAKVPALIEQVAGVDARLTEHLEASVQAASMAAQEGQDMWRAIEAIAKAQPPSSTTTATPVADDREETDRASC